VDNDAAIKIKCKHALLWESWHRTASSMGSRPTCGALSRMVRRRTRAARPSQPRPSLEMGWSIASGSWHARPWNRTGPLRLRRSLHPHCSSGAQPHLAQRHPHCADGAKRLHGEQRHHPKRALAEAWVIRARHPAQRASSTTAAGENVAHRYRWQEVPTFFRGMFWALPHPSFPVYSLTYRANYVLIELFRRGKCLPLCDACWYRYVEGPRATLHATGHGSSRAISVTTRDMGAPRRRRGPPGATLRPRRWRACSHHVSTACVHSHPQPITGA